MLDNVELRNEMRLEFPSKAENVSFARTAAALFASQLEFTLDDIDEIKVAVSEAVSNVVIHAYPDDTGWVFIQGYLYDDGIKLVVSDQGKGIEDVEQAMQPAYTTAPEERMGLGLVFIKEYMDEVQIDSRPGEGTRLVMIKYLSGKKKESSEG